VHGGTRTAKPVLWSCLLTAYRLWGENNDKRNLDRIECDEYKYHEYWAYNNFYSCHDIWGNCNERKVMTTEVLLTSINNNLETISNLLFGIAMILIGITIHVYFFAKNYNNKGR